VGGHLLSFAIWLGFNSSVFFLFFNFLLLAKIGDDPQENLAEIWLQVK